MQSSPITNAWGRARTTSVDVEHFLIFRGRPGMAYNHHHQITSLDGRLFATWSDAPTSEDEPGQHMVVAVSDDHGETWSEPMFTDYTDCQCRLHFGRLPDGRYFGVSCPDPKRRRTPMILAASRDGVCTSTGIMFWAMSRAPGHA